MKTIQTPVILRGSCPFCGKEFKIVVDATDYLLWVEGKGSVQELFPYLDENQREYIISGMCPECWNKEFNPDWK